MLFKEVIGQHEIKQRLLHTVNDGRISHAQLFLGPEGSGNLSLALAYAQYVMCTNKQADDACGECLACIKNNKMAHPDMHFVFPVATTKDITSKPICANFLPEFRVEILRNPYLNLFEWLESLGIENKQGLIGTEESGEILKKLNLKTYESEFKIMLIWFPEKLNYFSGNKLLKILEEPPEKTLFLLVAESQDAMLRTILSRTQLIKITKINDADLQQHLISKHNVSAAIAEQTAHLADGNYNEALKLLQTEETESFYMETFRKWMLLCYNNQIKDTIQWVDAIASVGREQQKKFLHYAMRIIREGLLLHLGNASLVKLTEDEKKFVSGFSKFTRKDNVLHLFEVLNKAYNEIERNAHPKILFLDLSFTLFGLVKPAKQ